MLLRFKVRLFNILQVIKTPLYAIPYKYGRIIYGYDYGHGAQYVWRNSFWPKMLQFYRKVDAWQTGLLKDYWREYFAVPPSKIHG